MNNQTKRINGILIDVSASMQESYELIQQKGRQQFQQNQIDKKRLWFVWNLILKVIQEEKMKNDYIFASAFGCRNYVDVVDLIPILSQFVNIKQNIKSFRSQFKFLKDFKQNRKIDYHQLLYTLVEQKGAINLKSFYKIERLKNDVPQLKAQLIYMGFLKKASLLQHFINQLPEQVRRIPNGNSDLYIQMFSSALNQVVNFATNGQVDYDIVNRSIATQIENLDNHINYEFIFGEFQHQLQKLISKVNEVKDDQVKKYLRKLYEYNERINEINQKNVENSVKYSKFESILQEMFVFIDTFKFGLQTYQIDVKDQMFLKQFEIKNMKEFGSLLKKEQNIISKEYEEYIFWQIEQLSYGSTPMRKCLELTLKKVYKQFNDKFLFIISDGESTDGDPIEIAEKLKKQGFLIICFYISNSNKIDDTQFYSQAQQHWDKGAKTMFKMSSEASNFEYPLSLIGQRTNIKLSYSGKSRLFLQGNDPKQMNKFFDYFMKIRNEQDALLNLVGKVQIEQYINSSNKFEAKKQEGGTCYANAIAAVYQLVMAKIYDREGSYPTFEQIRQNLIQKNGTKGGNTFQIAKQTCSSFRLQCQELEQINDIKQCLHEGRPLLARFRLCDDQWDSQDKNCLGFKPFFKKFPKGILTKICVRSNQHVCGHAVVLHKYTQEYYSFINSWGTNWGDEGFFKVKDLEVLGKMEFMKVFWTKDNLTQKEKESFKRDAGQKITDFYQNYFSIIGVERYTCPKCQKQSCIKEYQGNYYKAICPKCQQEFHPLSLGQLFVDYLYGKNM